MLHPFDLGPMRGERRALFWQDSVKRIVLANFYRWHSGQRSDFMVLLARGRALDSHLHQQKELEGHYAGMIAGDALRSKLCDSLRLSNTLIFPCYLGHEVKLHGVA
jgi:IS4 transposase